jgi:glutamate-ammonia-ligase adenylyltransferase
MAQAALIETERQYGVQPGAFVVLALGKFGGRELAERSDLDIMLVYDAPQDAAAPGDFYTRLTQRLITALSSPTEEGTLYEIDTQLRPSGSKGPVAVRLSSFERYYAEEAWTWELQALTRARAVAGDAALGIRVMSAVRSTLARKRDSAKVLGEVADMRARMERERRARGIWDLKLAPGGFVDIEFVAQALQLTNAGQHPDVLAANTGDAIEQLARHGALSLEASEHLLRGWRMLSDLQQVLRIAIDGDFTPEAAPAPLLARLAAIVGVADPGALETGLAEAQAAVRADFQQILGVAGDGSQSSAR